MANFVIAHFALAPIDTPNKTPLLVRPAVRRQAGLKSGDEIEFKVSGGVITILPKLPLADDVFTRKQRCLIDAELAEGLADIKAGQTHPAGFRLLT